MAKANGNKKKKVLLWIVVAVIAVAMLYNWYTAGSDQQAIQDAPADISSDTFADGAADTSADDGSLTLLPEENDGAADGNGDAESGAPAEEEGASAAGASAADASAGAEQAIAEDGTYTSKDDVALYLYTYGRLPQNFIRKSEAQSLGWSGGGLDDYAYGMSIGGDRFGNYEGVLPEKNGRKYYECDVGTMHKNSRGAKRIVFSNDGLIYYTGDHYESFTLLYGEE